MNKKRLKFNEIFYNYDECDILFIQPNMLQQIPENYIDPIQIEYWNSMNQIGSLLGDLPIEPNWGLLYLASNLRENGHKVNLIDFHLYEYIKYQKTKEFLNILDIKKILSLKKFKVVAISTMTVSYKNALSIAKVCKEINKDCTVLCGGIHFSFLPEKAMDDSKEIDAIIIGEGEKALVEVVKNINDREKWQSIDGLVYRHNGKIYKNGGFNIIKDIDKIQYPAYDLWPSDIPLIPRVYTARGCPNHCDYCVVSNFFCNTFRQRDINKVVDEIEFLINEYGFNEFLIGDLSFGANKKSAIAFCEILNKRGVVIKWWCQMPPDLVDDHIMSVMKRTGCAQIGIGIEAGDGDILASISADKTNGKSIKNICNTIKNHEIVVQGYFILGLPDETLNSAIKTISYIDDLLNNNLIDVTHISVLVPYPGTKLYSNPEEYNITITDTDYSKYMMNCDFMNSGLPVVSTEQLTNYQIYALWQLALSTAAKNYRKSDKHKLKMFDELDLFIENISFKNVTEEEEN